MTTNWDTLWVSFLLLLCVQFHVAAARLLKGGVLYLESGSSTSSGVITLEELM